MSPKQCTTDRDLLDRDMAIILATAPIWIAQFLILAVAGAWNDWKCLNRPT